MKMKSVLRFILLSLLLLSLVCAFTACDNGGDGDGGSGDNSGDNDDTEAPDGTETPGDAETPGSDDGTEGTTPGGGDENEGGNGDGGSTPAPSTDPYSVTVVDADGKAAKQIIVVLYQDGKAVKQTPLSNGTAKFSAITSGRYTVKLKDQTNTRNLYFDEATAVLDENNRSITITVYEKLSTPTEEIYFLDPATKDALGFQIAEGSYSADVSGVTYFVFRPARAGVFTVTFSVPGVTVINYGNPNIATPINEGTGSVTIEVPPITDDVTPTVIAIKSASLVSGVIKVVKTGELDDPKYLPWSEIGATKAPATAYDLPDGKTLVDIDVTSLDLSVALGDDGYYYTNSGELVLIRLGSASPYLPALAMLVPGLLEESEAVETFGLYVYEDGEFVAKLNYGPMLGAYYEACDADYGVVPLTEELANAIKAVGENRGWWEYGTETGFYLFGETPVNKNIAWLFACCVAR